MAAAYGQVPLQFEPNRGQTDPRVAYLAHGPGYTVYLTATEAVLSVYPPAPPNQGATLLPPDSLMSPDGSPLSPAVLLHPSLAPTMPLTPSAVLRLSLVGANPQAAPVGQAQLPGEVNYFYGTDPSGWLTHIPTFAEVRYPNVYPGIDLVYHGRRQQLEYDFTLHAGADPNAVRLQVSGAQSVALDQSGNLTLQAGGATLVQAQPTVYQEIQGQRSPVAAHYTLLGGGQVGFAVGSYDKGQPLVIDPVLNYSTYLGGAPGDGAYGIAVDSAGSAYITGFTSSTSFPLAGGAPYQGQYGGGTDAFVSKLNPAGSALVYSTFLGGGGDSGDGIAVDSGGNAYVIGTTSSAHFPTVHALQAHLAGTYNAFVSKLNPAGSALLYSTYLGGGSFDFAAGIAVDNGGNASVTGTTQSANFPTLNPVQSSLSGTEDGFVSQLNPSGSALTYSTYLGGGSTDWAVGVAVDSGGNALVAGTTDSTNFPTANALQPSLSGSENAFVAKLGAAATPETTSGAIPWHPHFQAPFAAGLGVSVDLADGHVDLGAADLAIPGRGMDLTLGHTWDSAQAAANQVTSAGQGWFTDLTPSMSGAPGSSIRYTDATGAVWLFTDDGSAYVSPAGLPWQLTASGSGYTLTNLLTGAVRTFNPQGQLLADSDSYGNSNTAGYSGGQPTRWTNSGGRALSLAYESNLVSDVQSPLWVGSGGAQGQHLTYGYTGGQLTSQTEAAGTASAQTTAFAYTGNLLTTVTTPMHQVWTLGYNGAGQLISLTSPISGTLGQAGYTPAMTTTFTYGSGTTTVVRGAGTSQALTTTYTLDGNGEPLSVADGLGHTTRLTYDTCHDILTTTEGVS